MVISFEYWRDLNTTANERSSAKPIVSVTTIPFLNLCEGVKWRFSQIMSEGSDAYWISIDWSPSQLYIALKFSSSVGSGSRSSN
jgi:hypothetical protein